MMVKISPELIDLLKDKARKIRIHSLKMTHQAGSGHPGGSLSMADLLSALYFWYMRFNPANVKWPARDRLFLSKGHGCPGLYAALFELGVISKVDVEKLQELGGKLEGPPTDDGIIPACELEKLRRLGGILAGHPDPKIPGIEAQSGSLSHILSVAKGAAKHLRHVEKSDSKVLVILSDAELRMGPVYEAALSIAKNGLGRFIVFVDDNGFDNDGVTSDCMPIKNVYGLWEAMGWRVWKVADGNHMVSLVSALTEIDQHVDQNVPQVVFCRTKKGAGVSFMENNNRFHGQALNEEEMVRALKELGENEPVFSKRRSVEKIFPREDDLRDAFGRKLQALRGRYANLVSYAPNLEKSTGIGKYAKPEDNRHENLGVQEYNAVSSAAGAAKEGAIAFVSTFAGFGLRAWEQIRHDICLPRLPVCFVFSHAGLLTAADGPTAQCLEDISLMRSLPNMAVMVPSTCEQLEAMLEFVVQSYAQDLPEESRLKTPAYIRTARERFPKISAPAPFEFGRAQVHREGGDVTILCCGIMTYFALKAAERLAGQGIEADVLELPTIKPIPADQILASVRKTGCAVTAEEHLLRGGMGGAVAETLVSAEPVPMEFVCVKDPDKAGDIFGGTDCFGVTGDADELLVHFGLTDDAVCEAAQRAVGRKK
jgi:transketolase